MNDFRVNEIAGLRNLEHAPSLNGQDCVIILPESMRTIRNPKTLKSGATLCYIIETIDGKRGAVGAKNLIKRGIPSADDLAGRQAALCCIKKAMQRKWVTA